MKKVMLLAAVVAMVLAAAVPAFAQNTGQANEANVACVQTALQGDVAQAAASQYGDASNINVQTIAQECNIAVSQVNSVVNDVVKVDDNGKKYYNDDGKKYYYYEDHGKKYFYYDKHIASATASATAKASAPAVVEYEYKASAPAAVEYEYKATATATASAAPAAELPETGGSSLIALGAGVLLVAGGLLARRIVR